MIQTCKQCGAINQSSAELCTFCSARQNPSAEAGENTVPSDPAIPKFSLSTSPKTNGSLALQPEWRREVSHRLRSYRERHGHSGIGDSQAALEFEHQGNELCAEAQVAAHESESSSDDHAAGSAVAHARKIEPQIYYDTHLDSEFEEATDAASVLDEDQYEDPLQATLAAAAGRIQLEIGTPPAVKKHEPFQHLLIDVSRPPEVEMEGPAKRDSVEAEAQQVFPRPDSALLPVAELSVRRRAAAVDAVCLLVSYAVILGAFAFFGGRLIASKLDAFVCGAIFTLLYTQYFSLFTMMGGATPGMMLAGLRLVSFDGAAPEPRQLIRRSAGYLLSGGIAFMGFLWSYWDEDHLSWHDHISQTYITPIEESPLAETATHEGQS